MNRVPSILVTWLRAWADCYLCCAAARRQAGQRKVEWGQTTFTGLVWEKFPIVTFWSFILDSCFHFEVSIPSTMRTEFGCESPTVHLHLLLQTSWEIVALPPLSYLWPRDRVREYVDLGLKIVLSTEQGWKFVFFGCDWQCWEIPTGWSSVLFSHL